MRTGPVVLTLAVLTILAGCAGSASAPPAGPAAHAPDHPAPSAPAARTGAVLSAEPWTYEGVRGQVVRTAHYRIYMTETDALLAGRLPAFLEDALEHYRTAITPLPEPPRRLDAYLMDNRPQWARLTQRLLGDRAAPYLRIQRGGFATRGIGVYYDIGTSDTLAIAAHEGWHQFTQRTLRDRLPGWLEEGLACYMEGHRWKGPTPVFLPWANTERFDQLRAAAGEHRLLPLSRFITQQAATGLGEESGLDFYAQAWAVAHFLAERRHDGLAALLDDATDGRVNRRVRSAAQKRQTPGGIRGQAGLAEIYFETYFGSLGAAQAEYEAYVAALTAPGARDAITAGRAPIFHGLSR